MEKAKVKLFGVEITVSKNDVELHNSTSSSEYSSILITGDLIGSRKSPAAKKRAFDEIHDFNNINNNLPPFKKRFSATMLQAQVGGTGSINNGDQNIFSSRNMMGEEIQDPSYASSSTCDDAILDDKKVHSPTPLRCYFPSMGMIFSASELGFSRNKPFQEKNKAAKSNENKKKKEKSLAKSWGTFDKSIPSVLPLEKIPGLIERIGSQNGSTKPVFLYKKKLQESDVNPHLNRLFIPAGTRNIELMVFLSDEEKAAITSETRKGLEFFGIDKNGEFYNLRLAKWDSLRMNVINKEWIKMVKANNAQKGDWIELWGYRVYNNELRFVINFRKSETRNADDII